MFLHLSVVLSPRWTPSSGRHPLGRHSLGRHPPWQTLPLGRFLPWQTLPLGRFLPWQTLPGRHAPSLPDRQKRPLHQTVCNLLECILEVIIFFSIYPLHTCKFLKRKWQGHRSFWACRTVWRRHMILCYDLRECVALLMFFWIVCTVLW